MRDGTREDMDTVAARLNDRPRKTLDDDTPNERFTQLLAALAGAKEASPGGVRSET